MAKLYTRKSDGTYVPNNPQSVTNIDVVQTTGNSVTAAMSQDAVTKELSELLIKVGKFAEVTEQSVTPSFTINSINYERNTIVHCGVLSSLTIASITAIPMEVNICFQTGESVDDFLNIPADAKKIGEITCEVSSEYVMSILDGIIILGKVE